LYDTTRGSQEFKEGDVPLEEQVRRFCADHALLQHGDRVLLAVSGGPDSMALLQLLMKLSGEFQLVIGIAHVHHGLRGADADMDQRFVRDTARRLSLPFHTTRIEVNSSRERGESPEGAARRLRYQYLLHILYTAEYGKLATGHTLEDNVETILYRLISGTGPGGAGGMYPRSGPVIHPLLELGKDRLIQYLQLNRITYRIDRTNFDWNIPRNRIRHEILPLLDRINRRYREHFHSFASLQRDENRLLDDLAHNALSEVLEYRSESVVQIRFRQFRELDCALRRRIIMIVHGDLTSSLRNYQRRYLSFRVLDRLASDTSPGNKILYQNDDITVRKEYSLLVLEKRVVDTGAEGYLYAVHTTDDSIAMAEIAKELVFKLTTDRKIFESSAFEKQKIYLDYDRIRLPLIVRCRKAGDRISLQNLGHKKLKDLFIDHKVSGDIRNRVPVLESDGEVVGVFCSYYGEDNRVAIRCRITNRTERVLVGELRDWKK
jgi:tRNA(Ile)-lysidine synthase